MKKKKRICELWYSKNESSYSFFPKDMTDGQKGLEKDAKLILSIEASSWKKACQKWYDYLKWGKYEDKELEDTYGDWPFPFNKL